MGRYDVTSGNGDYEMCQDGGQYNPYNMKNNSSLMLDQTSQDCGVRKSLMDMPRKLNDYQRANQY